MQRSSQAYLLTFVAVLTVVCALLLAGFSMALKEPTEKNLALENKRKILGAVMDISGMSDKILESTYDSRIKSVVVDREGNETKDLAIDINIEAQYKSGKPSKLPVYKFVSDVDSTKFESYILPVYGNGLWDNIWGYVSLGEDFNTIKGAIFDHKSETPGLGARITEADVQNRFIGKKLFKEDGTFKGVKMQKGEKGNAAYEDQDHQVDGMSGATMTANGLNDMLVAYFQYYQPYFVKSKSALTSGAVSTENGVQRNFIK